MPKMAAIVGGFILNALGIVVPVDFAIKAMPEKSDRTVVHFLTGDLDNAGGDLPHIALWNEDGERLGQYNPKKAKLDQDNDAEDGRIVVVNTQNESQDDDPAYIMLSNIENDAICLASIRVSNGVIDSTFYGETAKWCGQSWYYSHRGFGVDMINPSCVWLDGDHTNDINALAMSWHVPDMIPSADKIDMYNKNWHYLCKSTPRFSFWGDLLPNSRIPIFSPKLEYERDSQTGGPGADKHPERALDGSRVYDKSVQMYLGPNAKRSVSDRRVSTGPTRRPNLRRRGFNHNPGHIIISEIDHHSARELCEHPTSYGYDFVSTVERGYCDMESKTWYPLCGGDEMIRHRCFDLNARVLIGTDGLHARDAASAAGVPVKAYVSSKHWK